VLDVDDQKVVMGAAMAKLLCVRPAGDLGPAQRS
jgi:hypothetical protein